MFPEGLLSVVLLVSVVTLAGRCVEQSDWARITTPVTLVALLSALFGSVIARIRILDSLAHLTSLVCAFAVSFVLVARSATTLEGGFRQRVTEVAETSVSWYLGDRVSEDMEALLVSLLMGIVVWLVGYLSAWSLFRRSWLLSAIFLPGFLILVNLGYADEPETWYLGVFALLSLTLIARHNLYARQRTWRRLRISSSGGFANRVVVIGTAIAILATGAGWRVPSTFSQSAMQPLMGEISSQALSIQDAASDWVRDLSGSSAGQHRVSGSYTDFDDSFAIGGPLELTNQPEALVFADEAPYLTAQYYDSYNGRGWYSTTEDTFNPEGRDGRRYSPEMTFSPNQNVPLSSGVSEARASTAVEITSLAPTGDRMLTVGTYQTSNVEVSVRMSWQQLQNAEYDLTLGTFDAIPSDMHPIASMLSEASLDGEDSGFGTLPSDAGARARLEQERTELRERFLDVSWKTDGSGRATTLVVTGQVPIYDDVESVFATQASSLDTTYRVVASESTASAEELRAAGNAYPGWVADRYLQLPDTVTARTIELAKGIAGTTDSPYDTARAIEQYLRTTITYDETVEAPPGDADIVDYLLFERPRGYCEYSASAMSIMLRAAGIPARVAVGFYPGDFDDERDGFLYRQTNAHAWVEAYFPGYGWIAFEPTSSRPLIEPGEPADTSEPTPAPTETAPLETPEAVTPTPESSPSPSSGPTDPAPPAVTAAGDGNGRGWLAVTGSITAVLLAIAGMVWFAWIAPLRGLPAPGSLYARLRRIGPWLGVRARPNATPREFGTALSDRVPQVSGHVHRIVQSYEVDQYGPEGDSSRWVTVAGDSWHAVRRQLPRLLLPWPRSASRKGRRADG
jgi:transglutaminase-like putative cysteine protease